MGSLAATSPRGGGAGVHSGFGGEEGGPSYGTAKGVEDPAWEDLVRRQLVLPKERLLLSGPILRRRLPCLAPRVLLLTDKPRLMVLDQGPRRKMRFELSLRNLQVRVLGEFEFSLSSSRSWWTYRCAGGDSTAEEWAGRIRIAKQRLLSSTSGI